MESITTVVCDDEPDAREGLRDLLRSDADVVIVGEARDGREAVAVVSAERPDLVFLDIQMPGLDGFGVLEAIAAESGAERLPIVVFVTAYDEFALRAFEVHALDYLLKPFSDARFAESLRIAKERVRQRRVGVLGQQLAVLFGGAAPSPSAVPPHAADVVAPALAPARAQPATPAPRYLERIPVRVAQKVLLVPVGDVDWIEADDYYARLHIAGRTSLVRETLNQLEAVLDPSRFVRTHRSAIVNIARVKLLQPYFGGAHVITLHDGTQVPLSRSRRAGFERALGSRI